MGQLEYKAYLRRRFNRSKTNRFSLKKIVTVCYRYSVTIMKG